MYGINPGAQVTGQPSCLHSSDYTDRWLRWKAELSECKLGGYQHASETKKQGRESCSQWFLTAGKKGWSLTEAEWGVRNAHDCSPGWGPPCPRLCRAHIQGKSPPGDHWHGLTLVCMMDSSAHERPSSCSTLVIQARHCRVSLSEIKAFLLIRKTWHLLGWPGWTAYLSSFWL